MAAAGYGVFAKVLIANRGAIACRIIRTLKRMGVRSVAVFSEADAGSLHVKQADEAVCIGPAAAQASYLNGRALIAAAQTTGAQAIHPGYGFLSENAEFAADCSAAGIEFIGPRAQTLRAFGLKHTARELAREQGVPLLPGSQILANLDAARVAARDVGFPVMLKATAGGGGIGMRVCEDIAALEDAFAFVQRIASDHFRNGGAYLERFVSGARHVEIQIFGDGRGRVVALGDRDCSLQRRNQKIIEETPAPGISTGTRERMAECAVRLAGAVSYRSAGTVEFLFDARRDEFYFLEVNTRLQVEHGVTEEVTGIDLVEWMVRGAAGEHSFLDDWSDRPAKAEGCAIQARIYAEDPFLDNRPSSGTITELHFPVATRVETWIGPGTDVSTYYDPMLAKVIVKAADRAAAVVGLQKALADTRIGGLESNLDWLRQIVRSDAYVQARISTGTVATLPYRPRTVRVLSSGLETTVQDYPGRLGYWHVGVPPSGPMDNLAFRLGNRLLGNEADAAGLEVTALGPSLQFDHAATICLTGAECDAVLDDKALTPFVPTAVSAGQVLRLGRVRGPGLRAYLLFQGGLDVPQYLNSRSTFTLGRFGGHAGRKLVTGDVLHLNASSATAHPALPANLRPPLTRDWRLRVLYGPHGAPDFFTADDIEAILSARWKVHYNSNRTGVRLIGPRPRWARRDGGEAGLHASNIHDNPYAVGALDFTGDMPILLGPDGPSLGGFVCPFVVIHADLWKLGQLSPGDTLEFECVDDLAAAHAAQDQEEFIARLGHADAPRSQPRAHADRHRTPVLETLEPSGTRPRTLYRRQGDRHVLVEYGPIVLDLTLRLRVHALMLELRKLKLPGVLDITPGIRSLQVQYDPRILPLSELLRTLVAAEERLGELTDFAIPSRVIWLPLSFDDPAVGETVARYMSSVRADAPWCPDNIEFIRRINGLPSRDDVRRIVFDARYLVMGLGDVYLGAPVAVPLDPRHRLVTTKYNPARTWTPPNVVGIGGAYLCVYGMEGPGGYQLFGRTIQVWNSYLQSPDFTDGKPWLLRFFDQIRFFEASAAELSEWRRDFPFGRRSLTIEHEVFRLADYRLFLEKHRDSIEAFQSRREAAFGAEREEWARRGERLLDETPLGAHSLTQEIELPAGSELVEAPLGGQIWRIHVRIGDRIEKGAIIAAIEAMKTECAVPSPVSGIVRGVYIEERQPIAAGGALIAVEPLVRQQAVGG